MRVQGRVMINRFTDTFLVNAIDRDYQRARRRATTHRIIRAIRRSSTRLYSFGEIDGRFDLDAERYVGIRQVPVRSIVGSMGRYQDFDGDFNPLRNSSRDRWERVAAAHMQGIMLPPVQLLKVGDGYLVRDGNHRISVARHYDVEFVDAEVIEYVTPCALSKLADTAGPARMRAIFSQARVQIEKVMARFAPKHEEHACSCPCCEELVPTLP